MKVLPRDDLEKQKILEEITRKFKEGKKYSEQEINEIINFFEVDDIELFRRELVNFNYLGKDSYKGIYWLKKKELSKDELERIKKLGEELG